MQINITYIYIYIYTCGINLHEVMVEPFPIFVIAPTQEFKSLKRKFSDCDPKVE